MIVLVLGGTRSGKSALAERLAAAAASPVTYIATASVDPSDAAHVERIARHRDRRPADWTTVECAAPDDLPRHLATATGTVLVDSLGSWLASHPDLTADTAALVAALTSGPSTAVVVSEEVGMAVHPSTELGRRFTDALGELNTAVAAVADRVLLAIAGRAIDVPAEVPGLP